MISVLFFRIVAIWAHLREIPFLFLFFMHFCLCMGEAEPSRCEMKLTVLAEQRITDRRH